MAYRTKVQALNDICRQLGGAGGHVRTVRALNEWAVLLGGAGGHVRNLAALNEISALLGGSGGHRRQLGALNAISGLLGGAGGHGRNLAALAEVAAQASEEEPGEPEPVPVYVVGDSNADPVYSPGSWVARTLARLDGRFFAPPGANLGAAGRSTEFAVRQLPFLAALTEAWGPGVVWYLHGFNPSPGAAGEAQAFIAAAKAMGHQVMWILPGAWTAAGGVQFPPVASAYDNDPAVRVIRTDLLLTNSGPNLEGTAKGDTEDGTHLNERGNLVVRDALLAAMAEAYGDEDVGYRDYQPATVVPMAGTGGAVMAPAAGQVPDGWQGWHAYSGDGAVEFACVGEDGRDAVEIRITGNSTATTAWLQLPSASGLAFPHAAGDFIDGCFSGRQVDGRLARFEITTFPSRLEAAGDLSEELGAGVWRSPGYNLPKAAGGSKVGIVVAVVAPAGASVTVRVWDVAVWKRAVPAFAPVADRGSVPAIGNPAVGAECAASAGVWFGKPNAVGLGYQWRVDGADVAGATGAGFTPLPAHEGKLLACRVTATNGAGQTAWTSDARMVRAAVATPPVIGGTPEVTGGGVVGTVHGVAGFSVSGTPAPALSYSWRVDGVEVGTGMSYTPVAGDVGGALTCEVTATNGAGSASAVSAAVTVPAAGGLHAETEAFLASVAALGGPAMAAGQVAALDGFYGTARASGWWPKFRRLYVGGLHCPEAGGIDLVDQATTLGHSGAAAPCGWSAALGWTGTDDARLDLKVSPAAVTGQNSVALILWYSDLSSTVNEAGYDLNNAGGGNTVRFQQQVSSGGVISARLHSSVNQGTVASTAPGFKCASRTAANLISFYGQDGGLIATDGKASTTPVATALYMWNQSGINNRRSVAAMGIAEGLDAGEVQGLRDALAALGGAFWMA